jgi:hypothetical protein
VNGVPAEPGFPGLPRLRQHRKTENARHENVTLYGQAQVGEAPSEPGLSGVDSALRRNPTESSSEPTAARDS